MFAEHLNVDHRLVDVAELDRAKQAFDSIDDFQTTAVTERQNQRESIVAGGLLDRFVKLLLASPGKVGQPADRLKANIFLDQFGRFFLSKFLEQAH